MKFGDYNMLFDFNIRAVLILALLHLINSTLLTIYSKKKTTTTTNMFALWSFTKKNAKIRSPRKKAVFTDVVDIATINCAVSFTAQEWRNRPFIRQMRVIFGRGSWKRHSAFSTSQDFAKESPNRQIVKIKYFVGLPYLLLA